MTLRQRLAALGALASLVLAALHWLNATADAAEPPPLACVTAAQAER